MHHFGFNYYFERLFMPKKQLALFLGIGVRTLDRYIEKDKAPLSVMLVMRSLIDGLPVRKNKVWKEWKFKQDFFLSPEGTEYSVGDLRLYDWLRINGQLEGIFRNDHSVPEAFHQLSEYA